MRKLAFLLVLVLLPVMAQGIAVSVQDETAEPGQRFFATIKMELEPDECSSTPAVYSFQFVFCHDDKDLEATDCFLHNLPQGWQMITRSSPGRIEVAAAGPIPLYKNTVMEIGLKVSDNAKPRKKSELSTRRWKINEEKTEIEARQGTFTVADPKRYNISGYIYYYSNNIPVHNVHVKMQRGIMRYVYITGDKGYYKIRKLEKGKNCTLSPRRSNKVSLEEREAITPLDASYILQWLAGWRAFSFAQTLASDVSGDGKITPYDASLILQFCVGLLKEVPADLWLWLPCMVDVIDPQEDLTFDFLGILRGDPTGNWGLQEREQEAEEELPIFSFTSPQYVGNDKGEIEIPILIPKMQSLHMVISYNPVKGVLEKVSLGNCLLAYRVEDGKVHIAAAGQRPLTGTLKVGFKLMETGSLDLKIESLEINERKYQVASSGNTMSLESAQESRIEKITVFDVTGRMVTRTDKITWDRKDRHGNNVKSGIYFLVRQYANGLTEKKKIFVLQ